MQRTDILIAASVVFVAASATGNVALMRQNTALRANVSNLRGELRISLNVPLQLPLKGVAFSGSPLTIDVKPASAGGRPKILFVLSPECRFCAANWANWHDLLKDRAADSNWQSVFVNIGPALDADYIERHGIGSFVVFQSVSADTALAYRLYSTPQTIIVDTSGRARGDWQGVLNPKQIAEIRHLMSDPSVVGATGTSNAGVTKSD